MSDRELLELAAKAAGIVGLWHERGQCIHTTNCAGMSDTWWRPHEDDGDALRLAIKLGICIVFMEDDDSVGAEHSGRGIMIIEALDDFGTRRAIVRAAAEIGKAMP